MDSSVKYYTILVTSRGSMRYPGHMVSEEIAHRYLTDSLKPIRGVKAVYALPHDAYVQLLRIDANRGSREEKLNKIKESALFSW